MNQGIIPVVPFLIVRGLILFMKFCASEKSGFLFSMENNISTKMTWSWVFLEKNFYPSKSQNFSEPNFQWMGVSNVSQALTLPKAWKLPKRKA